MIESTTNGLNCIGIKGIFLLFNFWSEPSFRSPSSSSSKVFLDKYILGIEILKFYLVTSSNRTVEILKNLSSTFLMLLKTKFHSFAITWNNNHKISALFLHIFWLTLSLSLFLFLRYNNYSTFLITLPYLTYTSHSDTIWNNSYTCWLLGTLLQSQNLKIDSFYWNANNIVLLLWLTYLYICFLSSVLCVSCFVLHACFAGRCPFTTFRSKSEKKTNQNEMNKAKSKKNRKILYLKFLYSSSGTFSFHLNWTKLK